ncbi:MAG: carbohydrate binding family 9 domain-containing protein [Bacteroidales bacterium]|nr:carbohydrate binding family 9 domain-containing protein [Bacteroidales bacterium]MCF8403494.1 carbohydrate binding family 9 domain-containing protein [Bacteroidales bacterium]
MRLLVNRVLVLFLISYFSNSAFSQEEITKNYRTQRVTVQSPAIDGMFDEEVWNTVPWDNSFVQREPYEGIDPTQKTAFKIVYDDHHIYVAIKAYDTEADKIEKRLSRRDAFDGDWVGIAFDSYNDKLTAFSFAVTVAGVKNDLIVTNEDQQDDTWDPVWYVKTAIVEDGWNAEMKIPLTQIRFAKKEQHEWGLQVMRWLFRSEEFSNWQHIPQESSRWVSGYGQLNGINGITPKKEVELIPYVMGNTERFEKEEGNPFANGKKYGYSAGLDGKVAVTNDLTLNFTVNPDFGQVEADPSEVNLTAFESYFQEKRPFFVEGNNIYDYSLTDGDGGLSQDNLFYSRRIGRRPHHEPEITDDEYMDMPEFTRILGAAKLSGKTRNGWSVGIMESLAGREFATIDNEGVRRDVMIEPLTNYFNARVQKDIEQGNTTVGGMFTATHRNISDTSISFLPGSAYSGGLDFTNYWSQKKYFFAFRGVFSQVNGTKESITELQESSRRNYQRPDATHLGVDTNLTALSGQGGSLSAGKIGGGHWRYVGWVTWRSPGLELNDMGYLRQSDVVQQVLWAQYRIWEPFSIFRSLNINFNQWSMYDFAGTMVNLGGNINFYTQFKNYWSVGSGLNRDVYNVNRSELRGGPALKYPGDWNSWMFISSDERKKVVGGLFMFNNWGDLNSSRFFDIGMEFTYQPIDAMSFSVEPSYRDGRREMQFVDELEFNDEPRYIVSTLNSDMVSLDFRINLNITPDMTFQYWGQPFVFSGNYSNYKRITDPLNENYTDRFHILAGDEISYNENIDEYEVDENLDGTVDYNIENQNFNFFEFRSNLVFRWEYIPGSTLYVVWSQGRSGDNSYGQFNFRDDMKDLYSIIPHNIFQVKFSYRISL